MMHFLSIPSKLQTYFKTLFRVICLSLTTIFQLYLLIKSTFPQIFFSFEIQNIYAEDCVSIENHLQINFWDPAIFFFAFLILFSAPVAKKQQFKGECFQNGSGKPTN